MDWATIIQGALGLGQAIAGQNVRSKDYPIAPPSKGQALSNELIKSTLAKLLTTYTGAPLSVAPKYEDLKTKFGDILGGISSDLGKYSGATAYTSLASEEPNIARATDLKSAIINRTLGDAGRRLAMGLKFKRRAIKTQDLADAMERYLKQLQSDLMARQFGKGMMLEGLYNLGYAGGSLYSDLVSNPTVSDIDVGDLAGVLGGYYG